MKQSEGSWVSMMQVLDLEESEFMREHEDMDNDELWEAWLDHIHRVHGSDVLDSYLFGPF